MTLSRRKRRVERMKLVEENWQRPDIIRHMVKRQDKFVMVARPAEHGGPQQGSSLEINSRSPFRDEKAQSFRFRIWRFT